MYVQLVGFKCHVDTKYNFVTDSITLLNGSSGTGKTTILQSIYWGLYGSMRGIYNNTGESTKCSVTLKLNTFLEGKLKTVIIYRQKRSELLRITVSNNVDIKQRNDKESNNDEKVYEDDVAQGVINQIFGSKELWKACSYIEQKQRCSLLVGSSSERMELLNQLSFQQDNPKEYISKISQELKIFNTQFLQIQTAYNTELDIFTKQINLRPVKNVFPADKIESVKIQIPLLEQEIRSVYERVKTHERSLGTYNSIVSQISNMETQLNNLEIAYNKIKDNVNNENISADRDYNLEIYNLRSEVNILQQQSTQLNQLNQLNNTYLVLKTSFELLESHIDISLANKYNNINSEYIWNISNMEQRRSTNINKCNQLKCSYDQEQISSLIKLYQEQILTEQNRERYHKIYLNLQEQQRQLNSLTNILSKQKLMDINNQNIIDLETEIKNISIDLSDMKKGLELLSCPECSKPLRYINGSLLPGEREPVSREKIHETEQKLKSVTNILSTVRSYISTQDFIKQLEKNLEGVDISTINNMVNKSNLNYLISQLSSIEIINEIETPSSLLKEILEYNNIQTQLKLAENNYNERLQQYEHKYNQKYDQKYNQNISQIKENIQIKEREILKLSDEYKSILYLQTQQIQIKTQKDNLYSQINQINQNILELKNNKENIEKQLDYTASDLYRLKQEDLNKLKIELDDGIYGNNMLQKQQNLTTKREELITNNLDLSGLQKLKQTSINIECKQLEMTVYNINKTLDDILPYFFTEPITLRFSMYKILKTKKTVKPGLNLSIQYKGADYDNINALSGGEGDRISLAVIIALNQVSNSPILLLDECISSLDSNLKESCLLAIKSNLNKTIICVDHSGLDGFYDQVLSI